MSNPQGQGPPQPQGPPYAPHSSSLGGVPSTIPDVAITAVFLFLYVVFAITHFRILKLNSARGHKFVFSGALFGFCKIRVVTMSLRIAWSSYPRNVSLGIAAQVFVYVGTIILFLVNWFFTQRIVRAQHARWGWSMPYRVVHRVAIVCLVLCLLMLVVAAIQQFFTLDPNTLRIDRNLQLTGQTYFAAFCFAPLVLIAISLILPRRGTEKFGAGRLRNNIAILAIAATILSAGAIFRCVIAWLPPTPLRTAQGAPLPAPWYFSKACFYVFNFLTELFVVIFYAVMRVDLRFHVPNGSKKSGDYSKKRQSRYNIGVIGNEKNLKRASGGPVGGIFTNDSKDTLQEYQGSLFDDTRTLADSLRYPSSVLEVDPKSGHWKIKRISQDTSMGSVRYSCGSSPSIWNPDRDTFVADDAPPVPHLPTDWPLRESQLPRGSVPVMEHRNRRSTSAGTSARSNEIYGHDMNRVDMGNAIADAISKLEENSEQNRRRAPSPPSYDAITPVSRPSSRGSALPIKKVYQPGSDIPVKYTYSRASSSSDLPKKHTPRLSTNSDMSQKHAYTQTSPTLPRKHKYSPSAGSDIPKKQTYAPPSSPPLPPFDLPKKIDYSAIGTAKSKQPEEEEQQQQQRSPTTDRTASFDTAEEEFRRFSFEAPLRPGDEGYEGPDSGNGSESERDLERGNRY